MVSNVTVLGINILRNNTSFLNQKDHHIIYFIGSNAFRNASPINLPKEYVNLSTLDYL